MADLTLRFRPVSPAPIATCAHFLSASSFPPLANISVFQSPTTPIIDITGHPSCESCFDSYAYRAHNIPPSPHLSSQSHFFSSPAPIPVPPPPSKWGRSSIGGSSPKSLSPVRTSPVRGSFGGGAEPASRLRRERENSPMVRSYDELGEKLRRAGIETRPPPIVKVEGSSSPERKGRGGGVASKKENRPAEILEEREEEGEGRKMPLEVVEEVKKSSALAARLKMFGGGDGVGVGPTTTRTATKARPASISGISALKSVEREKEEQKMPRSRPFSTSYLSPASTPAWEKSTTTTTPASTYRSTLRSISPDKITSPYSTSPDKITPSFSASPPKANSLWATSISTSPPKSTSTLPTSPQKSKSNSLSFESSSPPKASSSLSTSPPKSTSSFSTSPPKSTSSFSASLPKSSSSFSASPPKSSSSFTKPPNSNSPSLPRAPTSSTASNLSPSTSLGSAITIDTRPRTVATSRTNLDRKSPPPFKIAGNSSPIRDRWPPASARGPGSEINVVSPPPAAVSRSSARVIPSTISPPPLSPIKKYQNESYMPTSPKKSFAIPPPVERKASSPPALSPVKASFTNSSLPSPTRKDFPTPPPSSADWKPSSTSMSWGPVKNTTSAVTPPVASKVDEDKCGGCGLDLGYGEFVELPSGEVRHLDCFCCAGCGKRLDGGKHVVAEEKTYHMECAPALRRYRSVFTSLAEPEEEEGAVEPLPQAQEVCHGCSRNLGYEPAITLPRAGKAFHQKCLTCAACGEGFGRISGDRNFVENGGQPYHPSTQPLTTLPRLPTSSSTLSRERLFSTQMCSSNTVLFYGIVVSAWSLVRAGRARANLIGPTMALKLIEKRYREGELRTCKGFGAVSKLPLEIWGLITVELYATALEGALADWLAEMRCDDCKKDGERRMIRRKGDATGKEYALPIHDWAEWGHPECEEGCMEAWDDARCSLHSADLLEYPGWRDVLLEHGVSLASSWTSGADDPFEQDATIAICLPLHNRPSGELSHVNSEPTLNAQHEHLFGHPRQTQHAVISRKLFKKPLQNRPLTNLARRYHLEVVKDFEAKIHGTPAPRYATHNARDAAAPKMNGGTPQWRLWTTVCSCD
ncbi:hypothetical protein P7C70_g6151, partial [Phenoliferia sp. Uapishka_3]